MECFHCKGKMVKAHAPHAQDREGYHISWESVPAWVCMQCGEALFEENEVHHIQKRYSTLILKQRRYHPSTSDNSLKMKRGWITLADMRRNALRLLRPCTNKTLMT